MKKLRFNLIVLLVVMGCAQPLNPLYDSEGGARSGDAAAGSEPSDRKPERTKDAGTRPRASDEGEDERSDFDAGDAPAPEDIAPRDAAGVDGHLDPPDAGSGPPGQGGMPAGGAGAPMPTQPAPEPPAASSPVGTWNGPAVDSVGPTFDACVVLMQVESPSRAGTARYRGTGIFKSAVNCRSNLTFIKSEGNVYSFSEQVTSGSGCMPAGRIDMTLQDDGSLKYEWFRNGVTIPQEIGTLQRVDACPD